MLLTLDIGNTNIKSALFENNNVTKFTIHSSIDDKIKYLKEKTFTDVAICSVNPSKEKILYEYISKKGVSFFRASIQNKFNLKINYETPDTLGMDRICSVVGAFDIASKEGLIIENQYIITIDLGTATTINVISPDGVFIGGIIAPGIGMMFKSLNEQTAQLPNLEYHSYKKTIGNSTESSIISGVFTATIGMINEMVNHLKDENDQIQPLIFITGGNAWFILPHIKQKTIYEEALVLKGLKVIYELNKIKSG